MLEMSFEDFQDGQHSGHLGYQNRMILAILNLHMAPMPPIKFGFNLTKDSGADVVSRFSSWIAEPKDLSNSESLCCSHASHQVWTIQLTVWEEMSFEEF